MHLGRLALLRPRRTRTVCAGAALCFGLGTALAVEMSDKARREVTELLARIEKSGCEFSRGATWYSGPQARVHLQRKYEYLLDRQQLASSEDFVAHAATRSSMSGETYSIRCGSGAPVASAVWLEAELRRMRNPPPSAPTK